MKTKLRKELGFPAVFSIATGAMISSGLFILPVLAYKNAGTGVFLAYVLAGLFVLPAMLSKAELSTAMPKAGGTYFFIDRSLGSALGTLGGLSAWFSLAFKSAFALVGIGIFFKLIRPEMSYTQVRLIAVGFLLLFVVLNIASVKLTGRIQIAMVGTLLAILVFYVLAGLPNIKVNRCLPLIPEDPTVLFATAGMVFVSYGGLTKIASMAEEVKNPGRTIPLAMIASWLIVGPLYASVILVTVGVLDPETMASASAPLSLGALSFAGPLGLVLLTAAGVLAVFTTANSGMLAASRTPMAMARDDLLPGFLGQINARFRTPHYAVIFTGLFMLAIIMFLNLEHLVEVASALMILLFMLVNLSVIVMRESKIANYRPQFRSPLYPWIQVAGIIGPFFLLVEFGFIPLVVTTCFLLAGLLWYAVYARPRTSRESGLLYMVQRLASRHMSKGLLRKELRQIIMERDDIVADRFDHLIHDCAILDCEEGTTIDWLFKKASETIGDRLKVDSNLVYDLLWKRERESSTAIAPGLAIPHVIVPGENKFDLVVARCKAGIPFEEDMPPVHTAFVLAGTMDERNFHLKSLAAIAQMAQDKEFDSQWLKAKNVEELRDAILLAERKR